MGGVTSTHNPHIFNQSPTHKTKLNMNIDKDAAQGSGNTFMEFNIGHVENLNPAAKTVVNNYYGTRVKPQAGTTVNKESVREEILNYVENTLQFVNPKWRGKYMELWTDMLNLPEVDAVVYDKGMQEGTRFNRKEVAHIICYLGKHSDGGTGIFTKYVATHIAASFKDGKEGTVRPELGFRPSQEIRDAIDTLMKQYEKKP